MFIISTHLQSCAYNTHPIWSVIGSYTNRPYIFKSFTMVFSFEKMQRQGLLLTALARCSFADSKVCNTLFTESGNSTGSDSISLNIKFTSILAIS